MPDDLASLPDDPRLRRLDRLGWLLDSSIRIPVIGYRIGWDAIIGLIPGGGDVAGLLLSAYVVLEAARFGVPKAALARMVGNVVVEALVGAVPVLGDLFDAVFKANLRNLDLLHAHLGVPRPAAPRPPDRRLKRVVLVVLGGVAVVVGGVLYLVARALLGG